MHTAVVGLVYAMMFSTVPCIAWMWWDYARRPYEDTRTRNYIIVGSLGTVLTFSGIALGFAIGMGGK